MFKFFSKINNTSFKDKIIDIKTDTVDRCYFENCLVTFSGVEAVIGSEFKNKAQHKSDMQKVEMAFSIPFNELPLYLGIDPVVSYIVRKRLEGLA